MREWQNYQLGNQTGWLRERDSVVVWDHQLQEQHDLLYGRLDLDAYLSAVYERLHS